MFRLVERFLRFERVLSKKACNVREEQNVGVYCLKFGGLCKRFSLLVGFVPVRSVLWFRLVVHPPVQKQREPAVVRYLKGGTQPRKSP